ncbi:MAG: ABC transporter substrate binding protein [Candidatus Omnitrophota bacterium]
MASGIIKKMNSTVKGKFFLVIILIVALLLPRIADCQIKKYRGKKILYVNSYHKGYYWSDGEQQGAQNVLAPSGVELRIAYMDAKNNPSEEFNKQAGLKVKKLIEEFEPDVLIVADDNAFKYIVMPYYRDADLPVVFCGINWDISIYGAPYKNTTGMLEVGLIEQVYEHLRKFAKGNRIGFLSPDVLSERRNGEYFAQHIPGGFTYKEYVPDFETWKRKYLEIQDKVDMLIFSTPIGVKDWDWDKAEQFVLENIKVPIEGDIGIALFEIAKIPEEQGEYVARTALKILDGEKPANIPIVKNKKGSLCLNLKVAEKLGVIFSPGLLRSAAKIVRK